MPEAGRMGARFDIQGDVLFRLPSGGPYRLEGEDISHNAIAVQVPLHSEVVDVIRLFFSELATIDHPALVSVAEGKLYMVERTSPDTLKWIFSFVGKQKLQRKIL